MTDNTQELDRILELLHNSWLEDDYDPKDPDAIEAKQAILDWHNKQTLELLDRLSAVSSYTDKEFRENPQSCLGKRDVRLAIEAERNKLKEPKL